MDRSRMSRSVPARAALVVRAATVVAAALCAVSRGAVAGERAVEPSVLVCVPAGDLTGDVAISLDATWYLPWRDGEAPRELVPRLARTSWARLALVDLAEGALVEVDGTYHPPAADRRLAIGFVLHNPFDAHDLNASAALANVTSFRRYAEIDAFAGRYWAVDVAYEVARGLTLCMPVLGASLDEVVTGTDLQARFDWLDARWTGAAKSWHLDARIGLGFGDANAGCVEFALVAYPVRAVGVGLGFWRDEDGPVATDVSVSWCRSELAARVRVFTLDGAGSAVALEARYAF